MGQSFSESNCSLCMVFPADENCAKLALEKVFIVLDYDCSDHCLHLALSFSSLIGKPS
jgi:hypothetical protein